MGQHIQLSEEEWRQKLTPAQYDVLRNNGTEAPFSGVWLDHKQDGTYECAACHAPLFDASTKFDAHCGWPSFYDAKPGAVTFINDNSHGMRRVAVHCAVCGGHLGHIFPDAPEQPTGQRYCINSIALDFTSKSNDIK